MEVLLFLILSASTVQVWGQDMMMAPDPMKTCVSLRLPWNPQPMYFCVEKEKFRYRNRCLNRPTMNCGGSEMRPDTLMLATPWDCCPYISVADHCMNAQCPPMPLNRQCKMMEDNMMMMDGPGDCCPRYFCEEGTPENCYFKRLEPTCLSPPPGKMNCIAFFDQHGCCPKYQCDGDGGKAGMCPMHQQAMQYIRSSNMMMNMSMGPMMGSMMGSMMHNNGMMMSPPPAPATSGGEPKPIMSADQVMQTHPSPASSEAMPSAEPMMPAHPPAREAQEGSPKFISDPLQRQASSPGAPMPMARNMQMDCVGDFNCQGTMKCCSHDMSTYGDGYRMMKNMNPTMGHCVEPIMTMPM